MKSQKKNKRKAPKRARAKPHDENKAVDHAGATDFEDVRAGGGGIKYEDAETFQRRNEALLPDKQTAEWADSFRDVLSGIGGRRGWISAARGTGVKRTKRGGRPAKKREVFLEAMHLRDQKFRWTAIAQRLDPKGFKENARSAAERMRLGATHLKKKHLKKSGA